MVEEVRTDEMTKYRVDIYIGSDNDSRKIHDSYLDKVRKWANATFPDGYTLVIGEGYYKGVSEDSILLYAFLNYDVVLKHKNANVLFNIPTCKIKQLEISGR